MAERRDTDATGTQAAAGGGRRAVTVRRTGAGRFEAENARGGRVSMGTGDGAEFTPVELLLAAVAGCSSVDVDMLTARRAEPEVFEAVASGEKVSGPQGNRLDDIEVVFTVRFPVGEGGDKALEMLPRAVAASRDRLCTVSRTIALGTPVDMHET